MLSQLSYAPKHICEGTSFPFAVIDGALYIISDCRFFVKGFT